MSEDYEYITYNPSESDWFNLISGMIAGHWIASASGKVQTQTILKDKVIGGPKTIGMSLSSLYIDDDYDLSKGVDIILSTHGVNTGFAGFNAIIEVPPYLTYKGYTSSSEFVGTFEVTVENKYLYILGQRDSLENLEGESVLLTLHFSFLGKPREAQYLKFVNGTGKDLESSVLLKWLDTGWYLIYPVQNKDGGVYFQSQAPTETEFINKVPISEEVQQTITWSETGLYTTGGCVSYQNWDRYGENYTDYLGNVGRIPGGTYCRNFWLNIGRLFGSNRVIEKVEIEFILFSGALSYDDKNEGVEVKDYGFTIKEPEWESCVPSLFVSNLTPSISLEHTQPISILPVDNVYNPDGARVTRYSITTTEFMQKGIYNLGCFVLNYEPHIYSIGTLPTKQHLSYGLDCIYGQAIIYYKEVETGKEWTQKETALSINYYGMEKNGHIWIYKPNPYEEGFWGVIGDAMTGDKSDDEQQQGVTLEGPIYSSEGGKVTFQYDDGPSVDYWLKPGNNNVSIFIPYIYPEDTDIVASVGIETEGDGYILIPLGFVLKFKGSGGPKIPWLRNLDDIVFIQDLLYYNLIEKHESNLDFLFEGLNFSEVYKEEKVAVQILFKQLLETLNIKDFCDITDASKSLGLAELIMALGISEEFNYDLKRLNIFKQAIYEGLGIKDTSTTGPNNINNIINSKAYKQDTKQDRGKDRESFSIGEVVDFEKE